MSELQSQHAAWRAVRKRLDGPSKKTTRRVAPTAIRLDAQTIQPIISLDKLCISGAVSAHFHGFPTTFRKEPLKPITIASIQQTVCALFGISIQEMNSGRRHSNLVTPRHLAIMLAAHLTSLSYPAIGRHFGNRDHTTIMHAVSKMKPVLAIISPDLGYENSAEDWALAAINAFRRVQMAAR